MPDIMNISCWSHGGEGVCPLKGVAPGQLISCPGKRPVWGIDSGGGVCMAGRGGIFSWLLIWSALGPVSALWNCLKFFCWGESCSLSQGNNLGARQGVYRGEDLGLGPGCSFPESFSVTHGLLSSVQPVLRPTREGSTPTLGSE